MAAKEYLVKNPATKNLGLILSTLEFCDNPPPDVLFDGRSFCLTGIFEYENGDRTKCEAAVRARGGLCSDRPNKTTNYIVLGTYADPTWTYKTYGKKILTAVELKRDGSTCKIISEKHWLSFIEKTSELEKDKQVQFGERTKNSQLVRLQEEIQQLEENQKLIFAVLKEQLKSADYKKLMEKLPPSAIPRA